MVLLDTHAWVWWVHADTRLGAADMKMLDELAQRDDFFVSAISLWEIAKLVEKNRLRLPVGLDDWFQAALAPSGVEILPLSPDVAAESTVLPGTFHSDPADQMIVATARVYDCPLVTADGKILAYDHVRTIRVGA